MEKKTIAVIGATGSQGKGVVEALIKANKDFDLVIFPNARHGFGMDTFYMMRKRWDYFVTHLLGKVPPKEFKIQFGKDSRA